MKRRDRSINIFNLSMLDVISGALGAFLIIMIILMPYYEKESIDYQRIIEQLQTEVRRAQEAAAEAQAAARAAESRASEAEARAQAAEDQLTQLQESMGDAGSVIADLRGQLAEAEARARTAEEKLGFTYLLVTVKWETEKHDVDLHVTDPTGAEFSYERATIPGRPGELSLDDVDGPGMEVWVLDRAGAGRYTIELNLYGKKGNPENARATVRVLYRDGVKEFENIVLTREQTKQRVAVAEVGADGTVRFP